MTDQQIPKCPYGCGAEGQETSSMAWGPHTLWGCGAYYIYGDSFGWGPQQPVQSSECKDRVIAHLQSLLHQCKTVAMPITGEESHDANAVSEMEAISLDGIPGYVNDQMSAMEFEAAQKDEEITRLSDRVRHLERYRNVDALRQQLARAVEERERFKADNTTLRNFLAAIVRGRPTFGEPLSPATSHVVDAAADYLKKTEVKS